MAATDTLFHTATSTAFADLMIDGHRETWPIRSRPFRAWLRRRYYQATRGALSAGALRSALDLLEARAQFDAPERAIHVRVAEHAGHIYLDLADEGWRAVEIGPGGWQVIGSEMLERCIKRLLQAKGLTSISTAPRLGAVRQLSAPPKAA